MKTLKILSLLFLVLSIASCRNDDDNDNKEIITNVYVAGYEVINNNAVATLWKNGAAARLSATDKMTRANAVYISGSDVYVAGYESINGVSKARLWKNGVLYPLSDDSNSQSVATSVAVAGNKVYVAGYGYPAAGALNRAIIWDNGLAVSLTNGAHAARANSVFASGNDVYAGGYESNGNAGVAKIWKNGNATSLSDGNKSAMINAVYVSGNDV